MSKVYSLLACLSAVGAQWLHGDLARNAWASAIIFAIWGLMSQMVKMGRDADAHKSIKRKDRPVPKAPVGETVIYSSGRTDD